MPCYEYLCECTHKMEVIRSFSESDIVESCPVCGRNMQKVIYAPLFVLADGFWYRNNYQNQGKKELEDALKENDYHRTRHDKVLEQEMKDGLI